MDRFETISSMSEISGMTKKDSEIALDAFLTSVEKALGKGEKVKLNNYLTLDPTVRKSRNGRNPQNGEEMQIPAKNVIKTSIGKKLSDLAL